VNFISLKKYIFTKDFKISSNKIKLIVKKLDDNNLLDTLKTIHNFKKLEF
jgi:hypothetical protein